VSGTGKPAARKVPCPTCGEPSVFEPFNPYRPFCSERCRLIDLGAWADEAYRVPGKPADDANGGSEEQDH
jgi:endogenous inhibitor of DNA gyrase (YacG/DUF329 family)